MAISTSYDFQTGTTFTINSGNFGHVDLASLSNGGFAAAGTYSFGSSGHTDVFIYDEALSQTGADFSTISPGPGTAPTSIAQLANSHVVNVYQVGTAIEFATLNLSGDEVHSQQALSFSVPSGPVAPENPDVAGLAGGKFAVTFDNAYSGGDHDIYVLLRNPNGSGHQQVVVTFDAGDDVAPSIAALADGGFAVAWTRNVSGASQVWSATYDADGTERAGPAVVDSTGTINRDVSVVALDDGGYGILYEDNGWSESGQNITLAKFDSSGTFDTYKNVTSNTGLDASEASGTILGNGFLAVSFTKDFGGGDHDIVVQIVNPNTGALIGTIAADGDLNNSHFSSIASLGLGGFVTGWNDDTDGQQSVAQQLVRTVTGDAGNNVINGDELIDHLNGAGGRDTLRGLDNDDVLKGNGGTDTLIGGLGKDLLIGGGASSDTFKFGDIADSAVGASDTIKDLRNNDVIDLSGIDADTTHGGNQAFHLVSAFTSHVSEAVLEFHAGGPLAGKTTLSLDVTGDGVADSVIVLSHDHHSYTNFVL